MVFIKANWYALMRYDQKTMNKHIRSTKSAQILKEKNLFYIWKINRQMAYLFRRCQIVYTNYIFYLDSSFKHILTTSSS